MQKRPLHLGFTLIELLVAVSIAALMIALINTIFNNTQRATSRGFAVGELIADSRGFGNQLRGDFDRMVGPENDGDDSRTVLTVRGQGGFLVILQHELFDRNGNGVIDADDGVVFDLPNINNQERRRVRSDQLLFFRRAQGAGTGDDLRPQSGQTNSEFDSNLRADYARVWYGHILETRPDGTDPPDPRLGAEDSEDSRGQSWSIGRQALLLYDDSVLADTVIQHREARYNSQRFGDNDPPAAIRSMTYGLADIANVSLWNESSAAGQDAVMNARRGLIVGDEEAASAMDQGRKDVAVWSQGPTAAGGTSADEYRQRAYAYTFGEDRLRGNPYPSYDANDPDQPQTWRLGQMHPVMLQGASDFIVEFAADINPLDGEIDVVSAAEAAAIGDARYENTIKWYTGPDYADPTGVRGTPTFAVPLTYPCYDPAPVDIVSGSTLDHATDAFVWRHDDSLNVVTIAELGAADPDQQSFWPELIRVRVRLHGDSSQIASRPPLEYADGLDNDNDGAVDEAGEAADSGGGIWFEFIVPVNRPAPTP